jgi:hypothetical protein
MLHDVLYNWVCLTLSSSQIVCVNVTWCSIHNWVWHYQFLKLFMCLCKIATLCCRQQLSLILSSSQVICVNVTWCSRQQLSLTLSSSQVVYVNVTWYFMEIDTVCVNVTWCSIQQLSLTSSSS